MKLISMTSFVLEQRMTSQEVNAASFQQIQNHISTYYDKVYAYAQFLKQPLTLGMFVPTDEEGRIWEAPKGCCSGRECGCMGQPVNYYSQKDIDKYYELEERVLFKGCEIKKIQRSHKFDIDYHVVYFNSKQIWISWTNREIEDFVIFDLQLTASALKQIGLNP